MTEFHVFTEEGKRYLPMMQGGFDGRVLKSASFAAAPV